MASGGPLAGLRVAHYSSLVQSSKYSDACAQQTAGERPYSTKEFNFGSGRARVRCIRPGIMYAKYSGVISVAAFDYLRGEVINATKGARAILIDMTAVLSTSVIVPELPLKTFQVNTSPGAVVCRADQLAIWQEYADKVRAYRVTRVIFLACERQKALALVAILAGGLPSATAQ